MRIIWKHGDRSLEIEHHPMPEGRFRALSTISGGVLLALVHMLGVWGLAWAVGALALVGVYKIIQRV